MILFVIVRSLSLRVSVVQNATLQFLEHLSIYLIINKLDKLLKRVSSLNCDFLSN